MSKKLVAFNSSWALDCHYTQFNDNFFVSEGSAILDKYLQSKGANTEEDKIKLWDDLNKDAFEAGKPNPIPTKRVPSTYISPSVLKEINDFRMKLADKCTEYFKEKVEDNVDFIAMVEQSIHVSKDHAANHDYGTIQKMMNKFDLTGIKKFNEYDTKLEEQYAINNITPKLKNESYGILKRLNKINENNYQVIDITDPTKDNNYEGLLLNNTATHGLVYDNVYNTAVNAAEGIGIIFKKTLVNKGILVWNSNNLPLNVKIGDQKNKAVHFYSDDLGPKLCDDENGITIYVTARGTPDYGRPIFMTGGIDAKGDLNIFVALHGPNFMNLITKQDFDNKINNPLKNKIEKINKGEVSEDEKKRLEEEVDNLYKKLVDSIGLFIQDGLKKSNIGDLKNKVPFTDINIYIGGDANDVKGQFMEKLRNYKITNTNLGENKVVKFYLNNYDLEKMKSCCANADSLIDGHANKGIGALTSVLNKNRLVEMYQDKNKKYSNEFTNTLNYGYNGDFTFFGSSNLELNNNGKLEIDEIKNYEKDGVSISPSDHLPVMNKITFGPQKSVIGGRRCRTRRRVRNMKRRMTRARPRGKGRSRK